MTPWKTNRLLLFPVSLLLLAALSENIQGQYPNRGTRQPRYQLPPPLYVKFVGPAGMRVTFYRGTAEPSTLFAPFTVGLRPGYVYRVEITDIPNHPGLVLHPTLEVRGSLFGGPKLRPKDFPTPLVLNNEDFLAIRKDSLVTKILVLESLDRATPVSTNPNLPLQFRVEDNQDPLEVAREQGTPFLIFRMGERIASPKELKEQGIPGTILLPQEKGMPFPRIAPYLPWLCKSLYDPKLGPDSPWRDLCIPDGGDTGLQVGIDNQGRLKGLDSADTIAEYEDSSGRKKIAISNRVCICVPRYVMVRGETFVRKQLAYHSPLGVKTAMGHTIFLSRVPALVQHQNFQLNTLKGRTKPSSVGLFEGTHVFGQYNGLQLVAQVEGTKGVSSTCKTPEKELPDRPLMLIKWPDKLGAAIGEVITFTLKYVNQGSQPIKNVVVSDSLSSRFEYISGSGKSDRNFLFTTQVNEAGSQILRWQITEEIPPGQSGLITFQVRVR